MALASWRLASLLVREGGPFGVFERLRALLGIDHDDNGVPVSWPDGGPGRLFACVWCMSIWTSAAVYGILWVAPHVVMVLAVWGAATLLDVWQERR